LPSSLRPCSRRSSSSLGPSFAAADAAGTGLVSYETLQDVLSANDMELNDQVLITLMRRYDLNKDGNIAYKDLMSLEGLA